MKTILYLLTATLLLTACSRVKDKTKSALKDSGEIVGQSVSEFGKGVAEGIEETLRIRIEVAEQLTNKGLTLGKIDFSNDTLGTDNLLSVYMIFNQAFDDTVSIKVFTINNQEMGRSSLAISAKAGEATFYDFQFDHRTNLDMDSHIIME